jgi:hypothetical protein
MDTVKLSSLAARRIGKVVNIITLHCQSVEHTDMLTSECDNILARYNGVSNYLVVHLLK